MEVQAPVTFDEWWAQTWKSPDALPALEAAFKEIAQKAWRARDVELAEARGTNGANIGRGVHPVHPEYGPCDAFAAGGMCSECLAVIQRLEQVVAAARQIEGATGFSVALGSFVQYDYVKPLVDAVAALDKVKT